MIGERDVVEIVVLVVGIERAPGAVLALHADDPFPRPGDRAAEVGLGAQALHAIHRHHHHGGVVDVRIVRIGVLERPAAGADIGPPRDPVAFDIQDLLAAPAIRGPCAPASAPGRRPLRARHGRRARCPRSAIRKAGNSPHPRAPPAASRSTRARWRVADDPPDSPARRTSSRCSPSPGRSRRDRPRR